MARSLYARLNAVYGVPLSDQERVDRAAMGRQRMLDARLLPGMLDTVALGAADRLRSLRVAVIGGGFAGLAAAWYLQQCGVSVTVFEASDRLGGRVFTDHDFIPDKTVEVGAELIGTNHAMWIELADAFGLERVEISTDEDYEQADLYVRLRLGDHDLDSDERKQLFVELEPVIDAIGDDARDIDQFKPWRSPNAAVFDAMTVAERLDQIMGPVSTRARAAMDLIVGNDNCSPPEHQSYLGLLAQVSAGRMGDDQKGLRGYWEYTETHRCRGGNQQLAHQLAAALPDIRYDSPVEKVTIDEGVTAGISWGGTAPGEEAFDFAVLAAPPTSWPVVESAYPWEPAEWTMTHGPAVKHLSAFDVPYWLDERLAPSALWDRMGTLWESTDNQGEWGGFGLSVFSGGDFVRAGSDYPALLDEIFPGYAPTAVQFADWPSVPYIWTGYSVPARGEVGTVGRNLAVPFAAQMFFAGEQAYVPFLGYMEGALRSGARAARDIVAAVCPEALGTSNPDATGGA